MTPIGCIKCIFNIKYNLESGNLYMTTLHQDTIVSITLNIQLGRRRRCVILYSLLSESSRQIGRYADGPTSFFSRSELRLVFAFSHNFERIPSSEHNCKQLINIFGLVLQPNLFMTLLPVLFSDLIGPYLPTDFLYPVEILSKQFYPLLGHA